MLAARGLRCKRAGVVSTGMHRGLEWVGMSYLRSAKMESVGYSQFLRGLMM